MPILKRSKTETAMRDCRRPALVASSQSRRSGTAKPRATPGRAISASYQRCTCGKSARSTLWRGWRQAQPRIAKSAIDSSPAKYSCSARRAVHHAVEAPRLGHEALQPVGALGFVLQRDEVVHLPGHRPEAAHLEHQPLEHRHARAQRRAARTCRSSRPGRSRIAPDSKTLIGCAAGPVGIDDGRDLVVRADLQEGRRRAVRPCRCRPRARRRAGPSLPARR